MGLDGMRSDGVREWHGVWMENYLAAWNEMWLTRPPRDNTDGSYIIIIQQHLDVWSSLWDNILS